MVVVEGTKTRRHTIGLIPKRRIFSCMISEGTVIQKSWHRSHLNAIAPHFFVLSDMDIAASYAALATDRHSSGVIFEKVSAEYERSCAAIQAITEQPILAQRFPKLTKRFEQNRAYLDFIHDIQIKQLRALRANPEHTHTGPLLQTMNCISAGLGWTG